MAPCMLLFGYALRNCYGDVVPQASLVTRVGQWLEEVYTGATTVEPQYRFTSLAHHPEAADISREDFAYYAALVRLQRS